MQGLIEFSQSAGYMIGPPLGGGLHEVRCILHMYARYIIMHSLAVHQLSIIINSVESGWSNNIAMLIQFKISKTGNI